MIIDKKILLKPIFDSFKGVHISIYLKNNHDINDLHDQIRLSLLEASDLIGNHVKLKDKEFLLDPISQLLKDSELNSKFKGNIAIFRTMKTCRMISIPINVIRQCHVSTSFHIKPLLSWLQQDKEFLFLGWEKNSAHLYWANLTGYHKVNSIYFPKMIGGKYSIADYLELKKFRQRSIRTLESISWLFEQLKDLKYGENSTLFVVGEKGVVTHFSKSFKNKNLKVRSIFAKFQHAKVQSFIQTARNLIMADLNFEIQKSLTEFKIANGEHSVKKSIFQITKAAIEGKVGKLLIAEDYTVYGKINENTGNVILHPNEVDHEDDDVLDDLAQIVIKNGGEVTSIPRNNIPNHLPIMAILKDDIPKEKSIKNIPLDDYITSHKV